MDMNWRIGQVTCLVQVLEIGTAERLELFARVRPRLEHDDMGSNVFVNKRGGDVNLAIRYSLDKTTMRR